MKYNFFTLTFVKYSRMIITSEQFSKTIYKQENAMRYNNRDDLLQLSFTLKISILSDDVYFNIHHKILEICYFCKVLYFF